MNRMIKQRSMGAQHSVESKRLLAVVVVLLVGSWQVLERAASSLKK